MHDFDSPCGNGRMGTFLFQDMAYVWRMYQRDGADLYGISVRVLYFGDLWHGTAQ